MNIECTVSLLRPLGSDHRGGGEYSVWGFSLSFLVFFFRALKCSHYKLCYLVMLQCLTSVCLNNCKLPFFCDMFNLVHWYLKGCSKLSCTGYWKAAFGLLSRLLVYPVTNHGAMYQNSTWKWRSRPIAVFLPSCYPKTSTESALQAGVTSLLCFYSTRSLPLKDEILKLA